MTSGQVLKTPRQEIPLMTGRVLLTTYLEAEAETSMFGGMMVWLTCP